jgi:hypothetical protein
MDETVSDKIYLIGRSEDYKSYLENTLNIDELPIANLPMCYFPFFYNDNENSIEKMRRLVPLIENNSKNSANGSDGSDGSDGTDGTDKVNAINTIDTDKLFSLLTNLEESYQPFNNNNIYHIKMFIYIVWIVLGFSFLKIISYFMGPNYIYFILSLIILLLVISILWALLVTSKSL